MCARTPAGRHNLHVIDLPPDTAFIANTPRLRLQPVTAADAEEMFVLLNDQRLHRFIGGLPLGLAELGERYRSLEGRRTVDGELVLLTWAVRLVPLGDAIAEIRATVDDAGVADIGITVGARWQGHGFACEGLWAAIRLLIGHLAVTRLVTGVPPGHLGAGRLAEHLRLTPDGIDARGWERWVGSADAAAAALAVDLAEVTGRPAGSATVREA